MKITDIRRERLRGLIEKHSVGKLSTMLGYRQPSFLSQMAGPNPTRDITEKTARRFERELKLPDGYLDEMEQTDEAANRQRRATDHTPAAGSDTALVAEVIRLVGSICSGEEISLPPMKFADVVALAYIDTVEHKGAPRPEHIKSIVRLLK